MLLCLSAAEAWQGWDLHGGVLQAGEAAAVLAWGRAGTAKQTVVLLAPKRLEGSSSDSAVRTHGEVAGRVEMQQNSEQSG